MVDGVGVEAFDEAQFVGDPAGVGQEITDPGATLPVLPEGLDRREHELAVGLACHGAEALAADVGIGQWLSMEFEQLRLVVEEIDMGGRAILKQINGVLGLGRMMRPCLRRKRWTWVGCRGPARSEQLAQSRKPQACARATEELAAGFTKQEFLVGHQRVHSLVRASSRFSTVLQTTVQAASSTGFTLDGGVISPVRIHWAASSGWRV